MKIIDGWWMLVIHRDKAYVPTTAITTTGLYTMVEPLEIVSASNPSEVERALLRAVMRGNPVIPTPSSFEELGISLFKRTEAKSESAFRKASRDWRLSKNNGVYKIIPYRAVDRSARNRVPDKSRAETLPDAKPLSEVIHRLVALALADPDTQPAHSPKG